MGRFNFIRGLPGPVRTSEAALTIGGVTSSASATHQPPVFSASAALTIGGASASASSTSQPSEPPPGTLVPCKPGWGWSWKCCRTEETGTSTSTGTEEDTGTSPPPPEPTGTSTATSSNILSCSECPDGMSQCWEITVAGIANKNCSVCEGYNGTFVLDNRLEGLGQCQFRSPGLSGCNNVCNPSTPDSDFWQMEFSVNQWLITATGLGGIQWVLTSGDPCNNDVLTFSRTIVVTNDCCQSYPDTITATPAPCP